MVGRNSLFLQGRSCPHKQTRLSQGRVAAPSPDTRGGLQEWGEGGTGINALTASCQCYHHNGQHENFPVRQLSPHMVLCFKLPFAQATQPQTIPSLQLGQRWGGHFQIPSCPFSSSWWWRSDHIKGWAESASHSLPSLSPWQSLKTAPGTAFQDLAAVESSLSNKSKH